MLRPGLSARARWWLIPWADVTIFLFLGSQKARHSCISPSATKIFPNPLSASATFGPSRQESAIARDSVDARRRPARTLNKIKRRKSFC
jgi:hypothetical protein